MVRHEAVVLAARYPGDRTIDQICSIYSYLKNGADAKKGWSYVADTRGIDYFMYANETLEIGREAGCVGAGDCDDFAILMAALIESIGGTTRIIFARNNTAGGHAYTEVYLGQLNATGSQVETIIDWLKRKFTTGKIYTHIDTDTKDIWLNLDWGPGEEGNVHPGGPFFQGDKHIVLCVRDKYTKIPLNLPETPKEETKQEATKISQTETIAVNETTTPALSPANQKPIPAVSQPRSEVEVVFPDQNLEAAIRKAIEKPDGIIRTRDLKGLTRLEANLSKIKTISGLEYCSDLTYLDLSLNQIADISPLLRLTNLQSLLLIGNHVTDVSPLSGLTNLQGLRLGGGQITDISPLAGLTNLQELILGTNQITDVSPLAGINKLTILSLYSNQITDVSPLSGLTNLSTLYLADNQITDVSPLSGLTNLQTLELGNNPITDVSSLSGLTNLATLSLCQSWITDVSPLSGLTSLTNLYLDGNKITDVSPLAGLTNLKWLDLNSNQITDVSPFARLTNLQYLDLRSNQIADVSPLAGLTNLRSLVLGSNQITNVSPLSGLTNLVIN